MANVEFWTLRVEKYKNEETKWLCNASVEKYLWLMSTWADHKLNVNQPCYKIAKKVSTTLEVINGSTV